MADPKDDSTQPLEAKLRDELTERGPLERAGVTLIPGEWTPITVEQAEAFSRIPGVQIRTAKQEIA